MPETGDGFYSSTIVFRAPDGEFATASGARVKSLKKQYNVPQQEAADPLAPIVREGIIPGVSFELKRSERVGVIIRVIGMEQGEGGVPQLAATYRFRTSDGTTFEALERDFNVFPVSGSNAAVIVSTLDISDIPPGNYTLNVRIDDVSAKKAVGQRAEVIIR